MFKLSNVGFHQSAEAQKLDDAQLIPWEANKRLWPSLVDIIIIVVMSLLLYWGAWVRYAAAGLPEPAKYRCYALAFSFEHHSFHSYYAGTVALVPVGFCDMDVAYSRSGLFYAETLQV